jgi:hypothetical protein
MNNAMDTARSARERFKTDFTQIMLTVLGIIQGLALNQLAEVPRGSEPFKSQPGAQGKIWPFRQCWMRIEAW